MRRWKARKKLQNILANQCHRRSRRGVRRAQTRKFTFLAIFFEITSIKTNNELHVVNMHECAYMCYIMKITRTSGFLCTTTSLGERLRFLFASHCRDADVRRRRTTTGGTRDRCVLLLLPIERQRARRTLVCHVDSIRFFWDFNRSCQTRLKK